jgi:outer membrane protein TolC
LRAKILESQGEINSSWGDPTLKIQASNFPVNTLTDDETPMTGVEIGLSQKIPITNKYGNIARAYRKKSESQKFNSLTIERELLGKLWRVAIMKLSKNQEINILKENASWLKNNLKTSKRLYASGKLSQQAILDLEIRKSQVDAEISNKEYERDEIESNLIDLIGKDERLELKNIPWDILTKSSKKTIDTSLLALESSLESTKLFVNSSNNNFIPDITVGASYRKRSDIDGNGDFISASVSFPLPFSDKRYADNTSAINEKYIAAKKINNYRREKRSKLKRINILILKLTNELKILNSKTIIYSENSRKVTSKSYSLGEGTYIALLQSELKLQNLLLRREKLKEKVSLLRLERKLIKGESLHE